jgi:hypothetical protein
MSRAAHVNSVGGALGYGVALPPLVFAVALSVARAKTVLVRSKWAEDRRYKRRLGEGPPRVARERAPATVRDESRPGASPDEAGIESLLVVELMKKRQQVPHPRQRR